MNLKNTMNQSVLKLMFSTLTVASLVGCTKSEVGPAGKDGTNGKDGTTNVKSYIYRNVLFNSVYCETCTPKLYSANFPLPEITQAILDSGSVQAFYGNPGSNTWASVYSYYFNIGSASVLHTTNTAFDIKIVITSK
jgi:hypothetical protein